MMLSSRTGVAARRGVMGGATASSNNKMREVQRRSFHFGTREYLSCFGNLPKPDTAAMRTSAVEYLKTFNPAVWYDDPIVSLLHGQALSVVSSTDASSSRERVETHNALGVKNGAQVLASVTDVAALKQHITTYQSNHTDLRDVVREMEADLFTNHADALIGNQCLDFQKQDGITEMEEAIMANVVERRLNDLLLQQEAAGILKINRQPIYCATVSNFTNFLDLSRKTLRSLEVGIPVVVLGRVGPLHAAAQHSFRWTQLMLEMANKHGLDAGMITFLSCSMDDIVDITRSCADHTGNLYATCSRTVAQTIKSSYPNTIASTGGPNTLVYSSSANDNKATTLPKSVQTAICQSAAIESAGQCTALRHVVVPSDTPNDALPHVFDRLSHIDAAPTAMADSQFDGVFDHHGGTLEPTTTAEESYQRHDQADAFFKINAVGDLPAAGINEYWRKVVVDFSKLDFNNKDDVAKLAAWLNENQPISLAVNGPTREAAYKLAIQLFDATGLVVYTVGSSSSNDDNDNKKDDDDKKKMPAALTCQARPQELEVFGEFPPRSQFRQYTKFPVLIPTSNPSYDAHYTTSYLQKQASLANNFVDAKTRRLLQAVQDEPLRGYCLTLIHYLRNVDASSNPKRGMPTSSEDARTALWGLQRPPLGTKTVVHCPAGTSWDVVAPIYVLFYVTNARDQIELSIDESKDNAALVALCEECKLPHVVETQEAMDARLEALPRGSIFGRPVLDDDQVALLKTYPMAGQFTSLFLPMGHIKSTLPNDDEFLFKLQSLSKKWLTTLF